MHKSAFLNAQRFHDAYVANTAPLVVEIGSQVIGNQSSLRNIFSNACKYVGVDFVKGNGVDVVITDPYALPIESHTADVVISSSCFEHSEFFWLSFLEMCRIAKPNALIYLNAPSNGKFHRYPVDCWRFYPDSGVALAKWGRQNGYQITLMESFIAYQDEDLWNDFVGVFALGDTTTLAKYPKRIVHTFGNYTNGITLESKEILRGTSLTEDQARRIFVQQVLSGNKSVEWLGAVEGGTQIS